jgi:ABC-type sugar transport system ATPase subunit
MLVSMQGIAKSFPGVQALRKIDFSLEAGEVHVVLGENGAGKSTLMKILAGILLPDAGEIQLEGRKIQPRSLLQAQRLGISIVLQEFNLIPDLTVAENLVLINRPQGRLLEKISSAAMQAEAEKIFRQLGLRLPRDKTVRELSAAEKQLVEIAKALSFQARVIIMDEPTAALADQEVERLFRIIADLKSRGMGIVYISHRLDEIFRVGDRVTVLRDGEKIGTFSLKETSREELIRLMVGRELREFYPKQTVSPGEVILETRDLAAGNGRIRELSFKLRRGEILGLAGLVGAGRTELGRALFGMLPLDRGQIFFKGAPVRLKGPDQAIKMGICYLTEDRKQDGLFLDKSASFNLTISQLPRILKFGIISARAENSRVRSLFEQLQIHPPAPEREAQTFSGGNQQKLVLARLWGVEPEVLILDEPTRGIDVGAKVEIHKLIGRFVEKGGAVILISSELPELLGVADRILVLAEGRSRGELSRQEFSQEKILSLAVAGKAGPGPA